MFEALRRAAAPCVEAAEICAEMAQEHYAMAEKRRSDTDDSAVLDADIYALVARRLRTAELRIREL